MNPEHISDLPGIAPCGMPMEPVYSDSSAAIQGSADNSTSNNPGTVNIPLQKQQLIGVQIETVKMASDSHDSIRTIGRISPDENRTYRIIAATDGWIRDISGSTTGSVIKKDQLMAKINIYSNDFITWQQQYLTELNSKGRYRQEVQMSGGKPTIGMQRSGMPQPGVAPPDTNSNAEAPKIDTNKKSDNFQFSPKLSYSEYYAYRAKLELLNLGLTESQIKDLEQNGQYSLTEDIRAPVSGIVLSRSITPLQKIDKGTECFRVADIGRVWIIADVFNIEADRIQPGMIAKVSLPDQNLHFDARVSNVPPVFDPATRTLKVRLETDNPKNVLRPDMFVDVQFEIPLPQAISVPASAVLDSGRRQTVFVALGDGYFEPRTVITGWRSPDRVEIVEGLLPGEDIVVSGNFLIDSESRMRLATAGTDNASKTVSTSKKEQRRSPKSLLGNKTGKSTGSISGPMHD